MSKILTVCRGVPGSGKSFIAKALQVATGGVICSTDDFFIVDGEYKFDPKKLGWNHSQNLKKVEDSMKAGIESIIVDNTNVLLSHIKPYTELASQYGYSVQYVEVKTDVETCIARNQHGVPADAIRGMIAKYQPLPSSKE